MKKKESLLNIFLMCVIIGIIVMAIAVGAFKLQTSGLSVILGVLIAGMLTMTSTTLNYILESRKKERESVEEVRRDAQRAAIEVITLKLKMNKDVDALGADFANLFDTIFDCFEKKRKEEIGEDSNDGTDRQSINSGQL